MTSALKERLTEETESAFTEASYVTTGRDFSTGRDPTLVKIHTGFTVYLSTQIQSAISTQRGSQKREVLNGEGTGALR